MGCWVELLGRGQNPRSKHWAPGSVAEPVVQLATAVGVVGFAIGSARVVFGGKENLVAQGQGETPRLLGVWIALLAAILAAAVLVLLAPGSSNAVSTLPSGFQEKQVFSGLTVSNNPDPSARRIIAYGLRNPFRQTTPQTSSSPKTGGSSLPRRAA
jgi:hypothetical protein